MQVLVVDDERIALDGLARRLRACSRIRAAAAFSSAHDALAWLADNQADVAFLDIQMAEMDGLSLSREIKKRCPACAVVFVTAYDEYALQAIQLHASGYLLKPVRAEDVERELDYVEQARRGVCAEPDVLRVQCFGSFEVFFAGAPLKFKYAKTKELLAYLVDRRGSFCDIASLCAVLWEGKPGNANTKSHLRHLIADLKSVLGGAGCEDVLVKQRGSIAVVPEKLLCDYYDWLDGVSDVVGARLGEYMLQYSWAETTAGALVNGNAMPRR